WNGYREFSQTLANDTRTKRVWVNGEWGLRYYFEANGALPLERGQDVRPGEIVVSSSLIHQDFTSGGGIKAPLAALGITSRIPLRLIGIDSRSAYSTAGLGLRPFDISFGPIDFLRAEMIVEQQPTLEYVPMNAPEAAQQTSGAASLAIAVDKTYSVPGDGRELGIILTGAGFQK